MNYTLTIPAIEVLQPIGTFYVGVISSDELVKISSADIREMETELDSYMGIQRNLSKSRVKDLSSYVNNVDATFPTSIILAVDDDNAVWNPEKKELNLFNRNGQPLDELAKIIDGQHRIEGMKSLQPGNTFQLSVSIFVGADLATQANLFATVNLAQTKVNRSLVFDLYSYERTRSPQKSCHDIAVALDRYQFSPFYKRIKRLGTATPGREKETLTQAAIVDPLMKLISKDPSADRNAGIKGFLKSQLDLFGRHETLIFRDLWLDKKDTEIADVLINFFTAVKNRWPVAWDDLDRKGNVLPKTNGYRALMRFLAIIYPDLRESQGDVPATDAFNVFLNQVKMNDDDFNTDTFPAGTSGEAKLFEILKSSIK